MKRATHKRPKRGANRFPGIGEAAKRLGRTRVHVYRVLTGEREVSTRAAFERMLAKVQAERGWE